MRVVSAFFSTGGRTSRVRFIVVSMLAYILLHLCAPAWQVEDLVLIFAGLLMGVAVCKAAAEGARRLHDMGSDARVAIPVVLIVGLLCMGTRVYAKTQGVDWPVYPADGLAITALGVLVLWPGEKAVNRFGAPVSVPLRASAPPDGRTGRAGWVLLLISVGAIEAAIGALLVMEHSLYQNNQRNWREEQRQQAERDRLATPVAPPASAPRL